MKCSRELQMTFWDLTQDLTQWPLRYVHFLYLKSIRVDLSHLVYKMYSQFRVHVHVHASLLIYMYMYIVPSVVHMHLMSYLPQSYMYIHVHVHVHCIHVHVYMYLHVRITFLESIHKCIPTLFQVPRGTYAM